MADEMLKQSDSSEDRGEMAQFSAEGKDGQDGSLKGERARHMEADQKSDGPTGEKVKECHKIPWSMSFLP